MELWKACENGNVEKVIRLLQNSRIKVNWQDPEDSTTPLYIACFEGHIEIVKLLLNDHRVDINKSDDDDETPFYSACENGHIEIVKLLLNDKRTDVNKANEDGETPFQIACENGDTDLVELLLKDQRVDINKADDEGWTAFSSACYKGHFKIVNLLRNEKNKLNLKEEVKRYNQNLQQNKDIINSIGNLRDILLYFSEDISLEIKQTSIQNFVQSFKNCQQDQKIAFFWIIETLQLNDEITKIFKEAGGMDVFANSFLQSKKKTQSILLSPIMNIVSNHLFREHLGKNSEFLKSLTTLLEEEEEEEEDDDDDDDEIELDVAGILLKLSGYISDKEIVKTVLENVIFRTIRNNQSYQDMNQVLDCLMEVSAIDESKSILLEFGIKEIVQPFVDNENSPYHFISCIIQAFLSSNDVNQNNFEFGSNPTSPEVISKILDVVLNTFINNEAQEYEYTGSYFLDCYSILKALGSLARNEANMKELKNNGIVEGIIEFTQKRKDNLLKTSERTIEDLSTLIWVLSFDQDCKNEFLSNGIVDILKGFNVKDNENVKRAVDGALFTLIGNQNQKQNRNEKKGQVMISYCWAQKEKPRRIQIIYNQKI